MSSRNMQNSQLSKMGTAYARANLEKMELCKIHNDHKYFYCAHNCQPGVYYYCRECGECEETVHNHKP